MRNLAVGTAVALFVCVGGSPVLADHETTDAQRSAYINLAVDRGAPVADDLISVAHRRDSRSRSRHYSGHSRSFRSSYSRSYIGHGHPAGCGCARCRQVFVPSPGYRHYPSYGGYPSVGPRGYHGYRSYRPSSGIHYYGRGFRISIGF